MEIFCGIDWSEHHHDVAVVDSAGVLLARRRITDDLAGFTALTGLLAEHTGAAFTAVDVAIETDRGLLVAALRAAGHRVFAINPKAVDRYRDRHAVSGAKSDPGDALVLAHLLRTDRDQHRPLPDEFVTDGCFTVAKIEHVQDSARRRSTLLNFRRVIHVLSLHVINLIHSGCLRFVGRRRSTWMLLPFCSQP